MALSEYLKQVRLAIALKDTRGLNILLTRYLIDDCGVIRKQGE